jgi:hypothetical protein
VTVLRTNPTGAHQRIVLNVEEYIKSDKSDTFYVLPYDKIYVQ